MRRLLHFFITPVDDLFNSKSSSRIKVSYEGCSPWAWRLTEIFILALSYILISVMNGSTGLLTQLMLLPGLGYWDFLKEANNYRLFYYFYVSWAMGLSVVSLFLLKALVGEYRFKYLSADGVLYFLTLIWITSLYTKTLRPVGVVYGLDADIGNFVLGGSNATFFLHLISGLIIVMLIPLMTVEVGMPIICLCIAYKIVQTHIVSLAFMYIYVVFAVLFHLSAAGVKIFLYGVTIGMGWILYGALTIRKWQRVTADVFKRIFTSPAGMLFIVMSELLLKW